MVRLSDLPEYEREHLLAKSLPPLGPPVWVTAQKSLSEMRVALITTAGSTIAMTQRSLSRMQPSGRLIMRKMLAIL